MNLIFSPWTSFFIKRKSKQKPQYLFNYPYRLHSRSNSPDRFSHTLNLDSLHPVASPEPFSTLDLNKISSVQKSSRKNSGTRPHARFTRPFGTSLGYFAPLGPRPLQGHPLFVASCAGAPNKHELGKDLYCIKRNTKKKG